MNFKLVLAYDGTDYAGWQRQPHHRSIQGVLEEALAKIAKKRIPVIGAGRTDAGVHALAQVAGFTADLRLSTEQLVKALNALLPDDIRVISAAKVGPEFHPRRSAKSKLYRYRIFHDRAISPFDVRYVLYWPYRLDVKKMKAAARLFVREGDFNPFSSNKDLHPIRKVTRSEIRVSGEEIHYFVEANGFLRYMVRAMVGTLLEVGRGRIEPEMIEELFAGKRRTLASPTAPAKGLALVRVKY
jgi:tRNA pseudouridine38-40 synthase